MLLSISQDKIGKMRDYLTARKFLMRNHGSVETSQIVEIPKYEERAVLDQ